MKAINNFKLLGISILLAAGLAACEKTPGPAESVGKQIDQTASEAGKKIEETVDKAGDKMSDQSAQTGVAIDQAASDAGKKIEETTEKAGAVINDAEITAKIKAAILAEPGLKSLEISVDTVDGVVALSGSVDTMANSETAKSLAGAVVGVKEVQNKLVVKPAN